MAYLLQKWWQGGREGSGIETNNKYLFPTLSEKPRGNGEI